MASDEIVIGVELDRLYVSTENPRFDPQTDQRAALQKLADEQDLKLVKLAEDILVKGMDPSANLLVKRAKKKGEYIVLDGNRRVTAIKLMTNAALMQSLGLRPALETRYKQLHDKGGSTYVPSFRCAVLTEEEARHWILMRHVGRSDGVGTVEWDTRARHRFRGMSPALTAVDLVNDGPYIDDTIKAKLTDIALTNLERVLVTPDARAPFGVTIKNKRLELVGDPEDALARLSILVADLADNPRRVGDLYSKSQRVDYAKELSTRDVPTSAAPITSAATIPRKPNAKALAKGKNRKVSTERRSLIPANCILTIQQPRINRVYHELQQVETTKHPNSVAVLLRVFIELSTDHYATKNNITTKTLTPRTCKHCHAGLAAVPTDMTLREKIDAVATDMEAKAVITKGELVGIRKLISGAILDWNSYVHNKDYNPKPTEIHTSWDDIQPFIERLWAP
jgi:hypothetical protein